VNVTDYLLLASDDVSIFFDNRFVTKTALRSVSPGESFDVFLGIDPAVKVRNYAEVYDCTNTIATTAITTVLLLAT
jgi:hypothetical protein